MILILLTLSCVNANNVSNGDNLTAADLQTNGTNNDVLVKSASSDNDYNIDSSLKISCDEFSVNPENYSGIIEVEQDKNILLKNFKFKYQSNDSILSNENISLKFINNKSNSINLTLENQSNQDQIYNVSAKLKKVAKKIVGKTKGIDAVKKIAIWVSKNIVHEKGSGFYQSPVITLKRKRGNCCCHSDLFLQLCDSLGYTKQFKIYYIHVGTMKYGKRHFFNIVGNLCVDTDKQNPWGRGGFGDRLVYSITQYPYLPLIKQY